MNPPKSSVHLALPFLAVFMGLMLQGQFVNAQTGYTWNQIKDKFEAANPTLKADAINVDELKA